MFLSSKDPTGLLRRVINVGSRKASASPWKVWIWYSKTMPQEIFVSSLLLIT